MSMYNTTIQHHHTGAGLASPCHPASDFHMDFEVTFLFDFSIFFPNDDGEMLAALGWNELEGRGFKFQKVTEQGENWFLLLEGASMMRWDVQTG